MRINSNLEPADLATRLRHLWTLSAAKIEGLESKWTPSDGSPVFTVRGRYTSQGWTEWTQGFQYGSALLQFDATDESTFLKIGMEGTRECMATHVTHTGVHDHGFNNVSTYGNLRRLMMEERIPYEAGELRFYELALMSSASVQASRWSRTADGAGYIYSFNGAHSLFADTIRSLRILAIAHQLGHRLMGEQDESVSLLQRLVEHARTTASYVVYYGEGRDQYDTVPGRVVHECIFNTANGRYRCPSTQQGYSPFTTWTRGLAWIMCGYSEQLEFLETVDDQELEPLGGRSTLESLALRAAEVTCTYYIENTPSDGIPYWDTGAPGLVHLGDYLNRPAEPYNAHEPVDASAAAIAAQGLLRLGRFLNRRRAGAGDRYWQAGLTVVHHLLGEPYLSTDPNHQGLLLHSIYHRPNGWDYVPDGSKVPYGESSLWGDYHLREVALYLQRIINGEPYYVFYGPEDKSA